MKIRCPDCCDVYTLLDKDWLCVHCELEPGKCGRLWICQPSSLTIPFSLFSIKVDNSFVNCHNNTIKD